jgi:hypothetical protein
MDLNDARKTWSTQSVGTRAAHELPYYTGPRVLGDFSAWAFSRGLLPGPSNGARECERRRRQMGKRTHGY